MVFHLQLELSIAGPIQIRRTILVPDLLRLRDIGEIICTCFGWKHDDSSTFTDARFEKSNYGIHSARKTEISLDMPAFVYFLNYEAPFYFQPANAPFQKVLLNVQESKLLRLTPTIQLLESSGDNTPAADGTRTAFSAQTVNQQLAALQKILLPNKPPSPTQLLDESPAFKEELLNLLQAETSANNLPPIEVDDAELHQLLQQMADNLSETTAVAYSLHDCLTQSTKEELIEIIRNHGITGYSKLRKAELVALLEQHLSNREFLSTFFSALSYEELDILGYLCEQNSPILSANMQIFQYFLTNGICYMSPHFLVTLPAELRNTLRELLLDIDFQHKVQLFNTVHLYCLLDAYLYGVYPVKKLLQQIEEIAGITLTEEDLYQATQCRTARGQDYFFINDSIAHIFLQEDPQQLHVLLQQKNREYYQPDEDDREQFWDEHWLTTEGLYSEFEYQFSPYFQNDPDTMWLFLYRLDLFMHASISFETLAQMLSEDFFSFPNKQIKTQFTTKLQELWDNTVRWDLGGYTAKQMAARSNKNQTSKNNVISLNAYRQKK